MEADPAPILLIDICLRKDTLCRNVESTAAEGICIHFFTALNPHSSDLSAKLLSMHERLLQGVNINLIPLNPVL